MDRVFGFPTNIHFIFTPSSFQCQKRKNFGGKNPGVAPAAAWLHPSSHQPQKQKVNVSNPVRIYVLDISTKECF
jgi:hypothetical protein